MQKKSTSQCKLIMNHMISPWMRKTIEEPPMSYVQALRQESQLLKQLLMLEEQSQKILQDLNRCPQEVKASYIERAYFEQLNLSKSGTISELLKEQENLLKDLQMMQNELAHHQGQSKKTTLEMDTLKLKYLVIEYSVDVDGEEDEVLGKRCKFYPSVVDNSQFKFSFQEDGDGFLVSKISTEVGFTMLSHQIAFPSEGLFHMVFQTRSIQSNDLLIGVTTQYLLENGAKESVYFNFASKAVEHNGAVVKQFQCELACESTIVLVVDMNKKRMICCVDRQFQEIVSFHPFGIEHQSLLLFLGVSNNQTLIYFSNA